MLPSSPVSRAPVARLPGTVARLCNMIGDEFFPVVVWVTVFGVTRIAPSLVLRLSMSLPQVMDLPRLLLWRRYRRSGRGSVDGGGRADSPSTGAASSIREAADAVAAALSEMINSTPPGTSRRGSIPDVPDNVVDASLRQWYRRLLEVCVSLATYPQRLWAYLVFQHYQRAALADAAESRPIAVRLLLRLVTSFTSTWVHASGSMLFDTLVTYLSTRIGSWGSGAVGGGGGGGGGASVVIGGGAGPRRQRGWSSGWRDLLVASCVSTALNVALQAYWIEALTSSGELRALAVSVPPASGGLAGGSGGGGEEGGVRPTVGDRTQLLLSAMARLGSKESLYRLCRMALQPPQPESTAEPTSLAAAPGRSLVSPLPPASPTAAPAHVYLCGGNSFVFALSGFRFAYYGDPQQLTTAASNCVTDALDLVLRQARQRAAAQRGEVREALREGPVWRPSVSPSASMALTSSHDVVIAPAASLQLLPVYVANFAVGAGVGLAWRERHLLLSVARKVPVVRTVAALVFPLPPPPLRLPDALQELSPECHVLLVYADGRVEATADAPLSSPIVKMERALPRAGSPAGGVASPPSPSPRSMPRATRLVVAQELFCPIKRTLMCDPVMTSDNFTYDRDGIEEWLRFHDTAPLTNLHLDSTSLRVNWQAREQISDLVVQYAAAAAAVTATN